MPSVATFVYDDDRVVAGRHRDLDLWVLPGGGLEPGERPCEVHRVLAAPARDLDDEAAGRQDPSQHLEDRVAIAERRRGVSARIPVAHEPMGRGPSSRWCRNSSVSSWVTA